MPVNLHFLPLQRTLAARLGMHKTHMKMLCTDANLRVPVAQRFEEDEIAVLETMLLEKAQEVKWHVSKYTD
jgi:hypothetical protein